MSAIDPIPGQFDYSAANAFLDSFAHARAARCRGLTVSIDWGFWQELGMIDTARITDAVKQATLDEIQTGGWSEKGIEVFERIIQEGCRLSCSSRRILPEASARDHGSITRSSTSVFIAMPGGRSSQARWRRAAHGMWTNTAYQGSLSFPAPRISICGRRLLPRARARANGVARCLLSRADDFWRWGTQREVRLILDGEPSGSFFRIFSQISSGRWQEHARGEIRRCGAEIRRKQIDLRRIETRLAELSGARRFLESSQRIRPTLAQCHASALWHERSDGPM